MKVEDAGHGDEYMKGSTLNLLPHLIIIHQNLDVMLFILSGKAIDFEQRREQSDDISLMF